MEDGKPIGEAVSVAVVPLDGDTLEEAGVFCDKASLPDFTDECVVLDKV